MQKMSDNYEIDLKHPTSFLSETLSIVLTEERKFHFNLHQAWIVINLNLQYGSLVPSSSMASRSLPSTKSIVTTLLQPALPSFLAASSRLLKYCLFNIRLIIKGNK